jgi:hypothetical protein
MKLNKNQKWCFKYCTFQGRDNTEREVREREEEEELNKPNERQEDKARTTMSNKHKI